MLLDDLGDSADVLLGFMGTRFHFSLPETPLAQKLGLIETWEMDQHLMPPEDRQIFSQLRDQVRGQFQEMLAARPGR